VALFPVSVPPYAFDFEAPLAPAAPFVPAAATSFTFVKLTAEAPLTKAATLDVPAGVLDPSVGASTSTSCTVTADDTPTTESTAAAPPSVASLAATTAFAPVYVHPAPASPGHVTPPKIARPAPAFALVRLTVSA
jgi:hypothetical protein